LTPTGQADRKGVNDDKPAAHRHTAQHGPDRLDRLGHHPWPQRDEQRLASHIGADAAAELLPQLRRLEDDFYASPARDLAPGLATMGRLAAEDFRQLHPEISGNAVQALAWCCTTDYLQ
jgi:hypothetical protein